MCVFGWYAQLVWVHVCVEGHFAPWCSSALREVSCKKSIIPNATLPCNLLRNAHSFDTLRLNPHASLP
jgi:hypothetical protein